MSDAAGHQNDHDFHLVDPSPWPIVGGAAGFLSALGAVLYLHPDIFGSTLERISQGFLGGFGFLLLGLGLVLFCMTMWWADVIREALSGLHKPIVQLGLRYGMALFILSELCFFVAFFWAFFSSALFPMEQPYDVKGGLWPPPGIVPLETFGLPFLNTLILLLSSTTITWSHHALREKDRVNFVFALTLTIVLSVIFLCLQAFEYAHTSFSFTDGIYPSVFFMATGFHGFHVLVGGLFLSVCLRRALAGQFTPTQHFGFEAAAWYWHFVDVVWICLFVIVYWWNGGG